MTILVPIDIAIYTGRPEIGYDQRVEPYAVQGDDITGGASTTFGSSNFGKVTSAYDPRTIQLAPKVSF
jgi:hypothetical protein